jgi:DNA-binding transcriptional ArsR family regulator
MSRMKESVAQTGRPKLAMGSRRATLETSDGVLARFRVERVDALTQASAAHLVEELRPAADPPLLAFRTASPEARALLRERGISYVGEDGDWFLLAPSVYVERPPTRSAPDLPVEARSPFSIRASRVPRWLLLHTDARPSLIELARLLDLSEATVSRTARALADAGLIELSADARNARIRRVRTRNTGAMLDGMERSRWLARVRRQTWDVGARDASEALDHWRQSAKDLATVPYAIGGPAGAALRARVLEPADVLVWIRAEDLATWREQLLAEPGRPTPGSVTIHLVPDPFWFTLAEGLDGLNVADPVQLYLDCRRSGERALEAAEAIRKAMSW